MFRRSTRRARTKLRLPGVVIMVAILLTLLAALNTGINLMYLVFGSLASLILISIVSSRWNIARLRVFVEAPEAVHRGEPFKVRVRIENGKRLVPTVALRIKKPDKTGQTLGETSAWYSIIPAQMAAESAISQRYVRRGVYPLPEIFASSRFPFGFYERQVSLCRPGEILVYPRIRAIRPGATRLVVHRHQEPRIIRGEGDDFFSLREYQPGDDVRRIAWRPSAKRGVLVIREYALQTARSVLLALDLTRLDSEGFGERFEEAMELAASFAISLLNQHYKVAVATPVEAVPLGEGYTHGQRILALLARAQPMPETPQRFQWLNQCPDESAGILCISADASLWGCHVLGDWRVLHPREMLRA